MSDSQKQYPHVILKSSNGVVENEISYQSGLIMIHNDFISAQWHPRCTLVRASRQFTNDNLDSVHLTFQTHSGSETLTIGDLLSPNYQGFYFEGAKFDELKAFFIGIGISPNCFEDHRVLTADMPNRTQH